MAWINPDLYWPEEKHGPLRSLSQKRKASQQSVASYDENYLLQRGRDVLKCLIILLKWVALFLVDSILPSNISPRMQRGEQGARFINGMVLRRSHMYLFG